MGNIIKEIEVYIVKDIEVNKYIKEYDGDYYYTTDVFRAKYFFENDLEEIIKKYWHRKLISQKIKIIYEEVGD